MTRTPRISRLFLLVMAASAGLGAADAGAATLGYAVRAQALTTGPEANLWFVGGAHFRESPEVVGRVTPAGEVTEFPLGAGDGAPPSPPSIVSGPDGNLWFAEGRAPRVGRVTPAGVVTEFPVPVGARATGIAAGPDGALWFTVGAADRIGRIATDGAVTEYLLRSGSEPAGIAAGPDAALWFAEKGAGRIGRMTTNGSLVEYQLPEGSRPSQIVAGADGDLWFSDASASRIGRMTPAGATTWFEIPGSEGVGPLAAGPDGRIWFGRDTALRSISSGGVLSGPWCFEPGCSLPALSLAIGPGGELWFGGGTRHTEGGGGTVIATFNAPGTVDRVPFSDPQLALDVGGAARVPGARRAYLPLSCAGSFEELSCKGALRLTKRMRVRPGGPWRTVLLARGLYDVAAEGHERVVLRLTPIAIERLRSPRPLKVAAKAVEGRAQRVIWPIRLLRAPLPRGR